MKLSLRLPFLALLLFPPALLPDTDPGGNQAGPSLTVRVLTTAGEAVPGAAIRVTSPAAAEPRSAITGNSGEWKVSGLAAGPAVVEVRKNGFRTLRQDLVLKASGHATLTVYLAAGDQAEGAAAAGLRGAEIGEALSAALLYQLPLADRRAIGIVAAAPATAPVGGSAAEAPAFSLGGGRPDSQAFTLDGATIQRVRLNGGGIAFEPALEELSEVRVAAGGQQAEHGGSGGAAVHLRARSASSRYSGSLSYFFANERLDAANFFAPVEGARKLKPPHRTHISGATLGGPLRGGRTFFFLSFEGANRIAGSPRALTVPDESQRRGAFRTVLFDPASLRMEGQRALRDPFPGNVIPAARIDPVARNLTAFYPLPNASTSPNFTANASSEHLRRHFTAKTDHRLTDGGGLSGRYTFSRDERALARGVFPALAAEDFSRAFAEWHSASGIWSQTYSPSLHNELRVTYSRATLRQESPGLGQDWPARLGLAGVPQRAFPRFEAAGYAALGSAIQERRLPLTEQWQLAGIFRWRRAAHELRSGFELRPSRSVEQDGRSASGLFAFDPRGTAQPGQPATGDAFASLLLGFPDSLTQRQTELLDRTSAYLAAFAQDAWRTGDRLTLHLGVRWELDTPLLDTRNWMNGFNTSALNPLSGTPGVVEFAGLDGAPAYPYEARWYNAGPRFGFALRVPGSDTALVRGAYGIAASHPFGGGVPAAVALGHERSLRLLSPDHGLSAPFRLAQGVPVVAAPATLDRSFGAAPPGALPHTAVTFFERDRAGGYAHQYHLSLQQVLEGRTTVELSVLGNLGRKLAGADLSINQIPPRWMGAPQALRPFPQFADVRIAAPSLGVSSYHAGILRVSRRLSGGFQFAASHTWSKLLSNTGADPPYSDFYHRKADWGPAAYDIRHRFAWHAAWRLPLGPGQRFLNSGPAARIAAGWSFGSIAVLQTGPPFTVLARTDSTGAFPAGPLRADVLGGPGLPAADRSPARWFDASQFSQPRPLAFGNQGVNALRGAGLANFDFSILRAFKLREGTILQFRGELFNALNHTNLGLPGRVQGMPDLGVISEALPARRMQFGLRLAF